MLIWNNPLYPLRSFLLHWLLLSILSLKPCSHSRTRRVLTTYRHPSTKPPRSTTPKYICAASLRSINYLSTPQPYRRKSQTHVTSSTYYNPSRGLLHPTSSLGILRNPLHDRRWSVRIYILHGNWIPRPPRHYRLYFSSCLLRTTTKIPLYLKTPFRIRSRSLVLTLRRRSMIIPICIYLLMRLLLF